MKMGLATRVLVSLGVALLVLAAGLSWGAHSVWRWLESPLAIPSGTELEVAPGTSLTGLSRELAQRGWLGHPRWLVALARWRGDATRIQAGHYRLDGELTPQALLDLLVSGEVIQYRLTLIEGWTVREAVQAVRAHPHVQVTQATQTPDALAAALGIATGCPAPACDWSVLEGALFPDTYQFPDGTGDLELVRGAYQRQRDEVSAAWAQRDPEVPLEDEMELLVLASIVEKETGLAEEREQIAGVFARRLQQGMRLQSDPTVIYGVGDAYAGDITRAHLRTDTPYNTYTRGGLPPTPIALAGRAALRAAANPALGDALYFVATGEGDGRHEFSATLDAHNAAVRRYLKRQRARQQEQSNE